MRVVVTRRIDSDTINMLKEHADVTTWDSDLPPSREELIRLLGDADGALTLLTDRIDAELLDATPGLRAVSNLAVGYDNIDVEACTKRLVAACTTPDVLTRTTAEFTVALMFAVARQIVPAAIAAREGEWLTWYPFRFLGRDLEGATLGVVGLGRIGATVATLMQGFGMRVIYADERSESTEFESATVTDLLRRADVVTLHVPLTPETRLMIDDEALASMKPDALLINTARGGVIDTDALVRALERGRLGGVGLDVTDPEPLPVDHPLYGYERVTIVPHIASATSVTRHRMSSLAAQNLIAVLTGGDPPHCLNPEVLANA
ncbi:MAG TPA: D-glycerate dehydrogenase [Thermomicrobiales bacterium]|nr:D-glycerate dehydrogenase [Thermomicrobiales bacterium]